MTDFLGREYNIETWLPSVERLDLFRAFTHAGELYLLSLDRPFRYCRPGAHPPLPPHGWRRG